jgi:hypothetical protein
MGGRSGLETVAHIRLAGKSKSFNDLRFRSSTYYAKNGVLRAEFLECERRGRDHVPQGIKKQVVAFPTVKEQLT